MNVLILGGKQACGLGLPNGESYVAQFVRRLQVARHPVQVDRHFVSMAEAIQRLPGLCLSDYDLILLQFDLSLDWLPVNPLSRLMMQAGLLLNGKRSRQLKTLRGQLAEVLFQVRVNNRQVVLLSPLPHGQRLEQQFCQLAEAVYVQESREWQIPLFRVSQHLSGGDELFHAGSSDRLSAVAHEVLGSALHTFITEPAYTLWS